MLYELFQFFLVAFFFKSKRISSKYCAATSKHCQATWKGC